MNRYILKLNVPGTQKEIKLTEDEFLKMKNARRILQRALNLEMKYEILIQNYYEFELGVSNVSETFRPSNFCSAIDSMIRANKHLSNLLSSIRAYRDQIFVIFGKKNITIKNIFITEENINSNYFLVTKLRNHFQHRNMSGEAIGLSMVNNATEGQKISSHFFVPCKNLLDDPYFKSDVKKEVLAPLLNESGDIDTIPIIRGAIISLHRIYKKMRKYIINENEKATGVIESVVTQYKLEISSTFGLLSAHHYEGNTEIDKFAILLDWDKCRINLEEQNNELPGPSDIDTFNERLGKVPLGIGERGSHA